MNTPTFALHSLDIQVGESWDSYSQRFTDAVRVDITWAKVGWQQWRDRHPSCVLNELRNTSAGLPKWNGGPKHDQFMVPDFSIFTMRLTGYWLADAEQFRQMFEWYALHEVRELMWFDGERPWHPHKAPYEGENERSWLEIDRRWLSGDALLTHPNADYALETTPLIAYHQIGGAAIAD